MQQINIYIISLKDSLRRKFQVDQFKKLGLNFNFFNAIQPKDISFDEYILKATKWERKLKNTEVACFESHKYLWVKIYKENVPALILEDDAFISNDLINILNEVKNLKNIDLINLENRSRQKIVSKDSVIKKSGFSIFKLYHDTTGAAGYILWPSGAKKLLAYERKKGPALADSHIYQCNNLKTFQVEPTPIIQLDVKESYGFTNSVNKKLSASTVSSSKRLDTNLIYKFRRIKSQIYIGIKILYLKLFANRRYLKVSEKNSFKTSGF